MYFYVLFVFLLLPAMQRGSKAKKGLAGIPADTPKSEIQGVKQTAVSMALPIEKPRKRIRVGLFFNI